MMSVILITHNNADTIKMVLEKLTWAGEIIMVDAFSQDSTTDVARQFGAKVYQRQWDGYASQKRYALQMARYDWVLSVDSDEVLNDELIDSIKKIISQTSKFDGYRIKIVTYFLTRPLRFACRPFYQMRLFKKDKAVLIDRRVHEGFIVDNPGIIKEGNIIHYTSQTIKDRIDKINLYSTLEAEEIVRSKRKPRRTDILAQPIKSFIRNYILNLGFLDGMEGFLWAVLASIEYFMIYSKTQFLEYSNKESTHHI